MRPRGIGRGHRFGVPAAVDELGVGGDLRGQHGDPRVEVVRHRAQRVRQQVRRVGAAAERHRGEEGCIRLGQQQAARRGRECRSQGAGVLERDVAGEGHVPAVLGAEPGHLGVAGEAVEHGALGGADPEQGRDHLGVRVPVVDLQGEVVLLRDLDVRLERAVLGDQPRRSGAEEVEPGLANGDHARARREGGDLGERLIERPCLRVAGRLVGVDGDGGEHARLDQRAISADQRGTSRGRRPPARPRAPRRSTRGRAVRGSRAGARRRRSPGGCGCRTAARRAARAAAGSSGRALPSVRTRMAGWPHGVATHPWPRSAGRALPGATRGCRPSTARPGRCAGR